MKTIYITYIIKIVGLGDFVEHDSKFEQTKQKTFGQEEENPDFEVHHPQGDCRWTYLDLKSTYFIKAHIVTNRNFVCQNNILRMPMTWN